MESKIILFSSKQKVSSYVTLKALGGSCLYTPDITEEIVAFEFKAKWEKTPYWSILHGIFHFNTKENKIPYT